MRKRAYTETAGLGIKCVSLLTSAQDIEPASFSVGDSVYWKRVLAEYPASEYTVTYSIGQLRIIGTADGDAHLFQISSAASLQLKQGVYGIAMTVTEKATGARVTISPIRTRVTVNPDPEAGSADARSTAERILAAVNSAIEKIASKTVASVSVAGTSYTHANIGELYTLRAKLNDEVKEEERQRQFAAGLGGSNKILVRFRGL